jgi:antitoxin component YwqK of YwqJK toxin-antitoxin module
VENSCFESNAQGHFRTFHANRAVKEDYACRLGVPVGAYTRNDADGIIVEQGTFNPQGKKIGAWETFGTEGKRASLKHYRDGLEQDSSFAWDAAGRLLEKGFFSAGTGERLRFDTLNHLIERQQFAESHPEGESWVYYPTGGRRSLMVYSKGQPASLQKWHLNGKLLLAGLYSEGKRTGKWLEYGTNGKILESSQYQAGVLHGDQLFFNTQGKLMRKMRYEHGYPAEGKIPASIAR